MENYVYTCVCGKRERYMEECPLRWQWLIFYLYFSSLLDCFTINIDFYIYLATSTPQIHTPIQTHNTPSHNMHIQTPQTHMWSMQTHTLPQEAETLSPDVTQAPGCWERAGERTRTPQAISGSQPAGRGRHSASSGTRKWHSYSSRPSSKHPSWVSGDDPLTERSSWEGRLAALVCSQDGGVGVKSRGLRPPAQHTEDCREVTTFLTVVSRIEGN